MTPPSYLAIAPLVLIPLTGTASALQGSASTLQPAMTNLWAGESRQVFHLDLDDGSGGTERHVWTVGDGPLIRHAIDPDATTLWELQEPPADVTQNLLDIHFIPGGGGVGDPDHIGFACGVNGNVITTDDYGQTWTHFDQGQVLNQDSVHGPHNATLWRSRFANEDTGFTLGLWTFSGWNSTTSQWDEVQLRDPMSGQFLTSGSVEFYALELIVDPTDSSNWVGLAAGQVWNHSGGGDENSAGGGVVFRGRSDVDGGMIWDGVFLTELNSGLHLEDPWDLGFAPDPATIHDAVGYLCAGTGVGQGGVFRTTSSGLNWDAMESLSNASGFAVDTIYGLTVIDETHVIAAGYGGHVWYLDGPNGWTLRRGSNSSSTNPVPSDDRTGPLAGVHGDADGVYVVGSWGYIDHSTDAYATATTRLNSSASQVQNEHWRLQDVHFTSGTNGLAVGSKKVILNTTDGGAHWSYDPKTPNDVLTDPGQILRALGASDSGSTAVAVGKGNVAGLQSWPSSPLITHTFGYHRDSSSANDWIPSAAAFSLDGMAEIDLDATDWVDGDGGQAEFWATGSFGYPGPGTDLVRKPALLRTTDGGATWTDETGLAPIPDDVILGGVAFRSPTLGFAVGLAFSPSRRPVVYSIDLSGATPLVQEITVVTNASGTNVGLTAIDSNSAISVAVGEDESLFFFTKTAQQAPMFVQVSNLPSLGGPSPADFKAIAVPPGNEVRVLVSAAQSEDELDSPALGKMLYYHAGWSVIDAGSNKDIVNLQLSAGKGWGVAFTLDTTSENGTVADSRVLGFDDPLVQAP